MANNLKPFKRIRISWRGQNVRANRKTRCRNFNDCFWSLIKRIIFAEEKGFALEIAKNHQSNRIYGQGKRDIHASRLYYESSRFSREEMVLTGLSREGKTSIHFFGTRKAKVNSKSYI